MRVIREMTKILSASFGGVGIRVMMFLSRVARLLLKSPFPSLRPRPRSGVFLFRSFVFAQLGEQTTRPCLVALEGPAERSFGPQRKNPHLTERTRRIP